MMDPYAGAAKIILSMCPAHQCQDLPRKVAKAAELGLGYGGEPSQAIRAAIHYHDGEVLEIWVPLYYRLRHFQHMMDYAPSMSHIEILEVRC